MNSLLTWYRARSQREQRLLLLGVIVVPLILLIFGLVNLQIRVASAEARLIQRRQDLAWLQVAVPQLVAENQRSGRSGGQNETLLVTADRVARETGILLIASEPAGNGTLRVRAERAPFDSLVLCLGQLAQRYGIRIDNASIDATDADGLVNATLVLRER